ncbi:S1C family serine protease [Gemmatimonadota bacterium]
MIQSFGPENEPLAQGSGFLVDDSSLVTNYHVVEGAARIRVQYGDGAVTETQSAYALDRFLDLAVLSVESGPIPPLDLRLDPPAQGEDIFVVGSPLGLSNTLSSGIVSAIREFADQSFYQITAPVSPGSSGGPVLDRSGRVIGVATASLEQGQSLNFAVPASSLRRVLEGQGVVVRTLSELGRIGAGQKLYELALGLNPRSLAPPYMEVLAYVPTDALPNPTQVGNALVWYGESSGGRDSGYGEQATRSMIQRVRTHLEAGKTDSAALVACDVQGWTEDRVNRWEAAALPLDVRLYEWCDHHAQWFYDRLSWRDSIYSNAYSAFVDRLGQTYTGGGLDGVELTRTSDGAWQLLFQIQTGRSRGYGLVCDLGTNSPGRWEPMRVCKLSQPLRLAFYDGGTIGTAITGERPFDNREPPNLDDPHLWKSGESWRPGSTSAVKQGLLVGFGPLPLQFEYAGHGPHADGPGRYPLGSMIDFKAVELAGDLDSPLTGVWDVLYPEDQSAQARLAVFELGNRLNGLWLEQHVNPSSGQIVRSQVSELSGSVTGDRVEFGPEGYVVSCQGDLDETVLVGFCTSQLVGGRTVRQAFTATRRR